MSWTGKAVGTGLGAMILGPIGAAIGGVAGHWFDKNQEIQISDDVRCRLAILSVFAAAANANGEIQPKERKRLHFLANALFDSYPPDYAERWMSTVGGPPVSLSDCAELIRKLPDEARQGVILDTLSVLYADGKLDEMERNWLEQLVRFSGTNPNLWLQCLSFFERSDAGPRRAESLAVLGLSGECSEDAIKSAYRKVCLEYHPDRLGNLPASIRHLAEEKLQQINAAYERLQSGDGLNLIVMTVGRKIKALSRDLQREVVLCPLCETQNRLPAPEHHANCRCGQCYALLAVPQQFVGDPSQPSTPPSTPTDLSGSGNYDMSNILLGWYVGTCTNTTVGLSANLLLVIHGASGGTIHGELALAGDLGGGGSFYGEFKDEQLIFATCTPSVQTVIEWKAKISESRLKLFGAYAVRCDNPDYLAEGLGRQEGEWSCCFVRGIGPVDPKNQDLVWIFDAAASNGPISREEFIKGTDSGRWPNKAIIAMDDRTCWITVGQFLDAKQAGEN